jgi:hypothetical protein
MQALRTTRLDGPAQTEGTRTPNNGVLPGKEMYQRNEIVYLESLDATLMFVRPLLNKFQQGREGTASR